MSECKCNVPCWRWDATLCSGCGRTLPDESTALRSQLAARDAELATVRATIEGLRKGLEHYARLWDSRDPNDRRGDVARAALASQPADERWGVWCTNGMGAGSWWRDEDGGEAIFASRHAAELAIMHPKNVGGAGWT